MSASTATTAPTTEQERMTLSEEQLAVGKRKGLAGTVEVEKQVRAETAQVPVTLKKEEVTVERRPITGGTGFSGSTGMGSKGFGIGSGASEMHASATAEQAVVRKDVVPREEVNISKDKITENKVIEEQVRREEADIRGGNKNVPSQRFDTSSAAGMGRTGSGAGSTSGIADKSGRVVAHEERLGVSKETVGAGAVDVSKRVVADTARAGVSLEHDVVNVDRKPATSSTSSGAAFGAGKMEIPIMSEEAVVNKTVVPKEEIVLKKGIKSEEAIVQDTLKKETIDVKPKGSVAPLSGSSKAALCTSHSVAGCTSSSCKSTTSASTSSSSF